VSSGLVSDTLSAIEGELRSLWASPDEGTQLPKVRASTLNLVVVASGDALEAYRESTDDLSETHAGRVILVSLDGRIAGWEIEHDVSGVCRPSSGGAEPICNDRIELRCGAMVAPRIRSVLRALVLPEIAVIAEVGPGAPNGLVDALVQAADRVIVDSAHTSFRRIRDVALLADAAVVDRAFIRQHSWRELCARLFDDIVPALSCVSSIEVTSAPRAGAPDPALLLVGWFASRLGMSPAGPGRLSHPSGQSADWSVRAGEAGPAGEIVRVRFEAMLDGEPVTLSCERAPGTRSLHTKRCGARASEHEHALGHHDETWVLRRAIDRRGADPVYRQAVMIAAQLESAGDGG
jgi:glucose-6-phosphate dehydrogenase assembly protein OpcA